MNLRLKAMALACGLALAGAAQAVLPLEGRTITGAKVDAYDASAVFEYDPNQDITWLRDMNYAKTSGYVSYGVMPWGPATSVGTAMHWAATLTVGTFSEWTLPTSLNPDGSGPCLGYNCSGSQMGYLWYEVLGNTAGSFTNAGPFQNVAPYFYWSDTVYASNPYVTWVFDAAYGEQRLALQTYDLYAMAVRPGDVFAVPEPQTWAMLLMGLGAVMAAVRRLAG